MTFYEEPQEGSSPEYDDQSEWILTLGDMMPHDRDAILPEQVPGVLGGNFYYIGQGLTAEEFTVYVQTYDFGPKPPTFVVLHHTAIPGASWASSNPNSDWDAGESGLNDTQIKARRKGRLDGIMGYYRDQLGWDRGPHLFIDDRYIWLFTPMFEVGIHAAEGNGNENNYSIGIEVVGDYTKVKWPAKVERLVGHAVAVLYERLKTFELAFRPGPGAISSHRNYNKPACPGNAITEDYYLSVIHREHQALKSGGSVTLQARAVAPSTPEIAVTPNSPILGPASGSVESCVASIRQKLPANSEYANDVATIMGYYWKYAPAVGVDPFIAAVQCIFETDSLTSQWAGRPRRNPAGLGVHQEGGLSFASWEVAVQAHIGQLLAYALTDGEANDAQKAMMAKNPRHSRIPAAFRGTAKTLAGLNNTWNSSASYADSIVKRAQAIQAAG